MDKIQKIKQEIERKLKDVVGAYESEDTEHGYKQCCKEILSFINSLPEESAGEDLEGEMDKFYGLYRDKNGVTHDIKDDEVCFDWKNSESSENELRIARHFAEWQKEQLMKDAVEGEVRKGYVGNQIVVSSKDGSANYVAFDASYADAFCVGDKVKIIIIKENNK